MKRQSPSRRGTRRRGFTLLEIVLSIAILFGALTAIFQVLSVGNQAAVQGQFRTAAVLYAETKLNEAIAGVVPLQSTGKTPLEDDDAWSWSMTVGSGSLNDLLMVTVTVTRDGESAASRHQYSVSRLVRDPQIFLDAALGQ